MPSESYKAAVEKIAAAKREAQEIAKVEFEKEAKSLLDEMNIDSFTWQQYTPYFNDGDACVFGVYADDPKINGMDYYEAGDYVAYNDPRYEEMQAPYRRIVKFVNEFSEEDLLFMFGDHVEVTVSRDGIEVDDYDHD